MIPHQRRSPARSWTPLKLAATLVACILVGGVNAGEKLYIRANQLGYKPADTKVAVAFSKAPLPSAFTVESDAGVTVLKGKPRLVETGSRWGQFRAHTVLDFSKVRIPGRYRLQLGSAASREFQIAPGVYSALPEQLLEFMRQQRCGHNSWLGVDCHQLDGRSAFGPLTNGTSVDARGGWHDAGDLLKYMLTSVNATAQMLLAYQLGSGRTDPLAGPAMFRDQVGATGGPGPNNLPDVLDEARWGLEWLLKMHPAPDQLFHQVADDRDHAGLRLPQNETVDYGWGKGGARVVYFAEGVPQGLNEFQSASTGVANLAGRYAAAMGLAYQIWKDDPQQREFAQKCLKAGTEVYRMGVAKPGVQQGNSYKAPYRYEETTWTDDMEWGAAELYRATGDTAYLSDAKGYAIKVESEGWMGKQQIAHYQYYPFMNVGHYRLHGLAGGQFDKLLALYYRQGIERCVTASLSNPYRIGSPFIWCSNSLLTALVTQCLLYERMTGDARYAEFAQGHIDWLCGRNPWGYTMFTEIGSIYPKDVHLQTTRLTGRTVRGGLVDGPVYDRIFSSLKGVEIRQPDPLAEFQGEAVYHDDFGDYSSNEPTMDGTASAILMWVLATTQPR